MTLQGAPGPIGEALMPALTNAHRCACNLSATPPAAVGSIVHICSAAADTAGNTCGSKLVSSMPSPHMSTSPVASCTKLPGLIGRSRDLRALKTYCPLWREPGLHTDHGHDKSAMSARNKSWEALSDLCLLVGLNIFYSLGPGTTSR